MRRRVTKDSFQNAARSLMGRLWPAECLLRQAEVLRRSLRLILRDPKSPLRFAGVAPSDSVLSVLRCRYRVAFVRMRVAVRGHRRLLPWLLPRTPWRARVMARCSLDGAERNQPASGRFREGEHVSIEVLNLKTKAHRMYLLRIHRMQIWCGLDSIVADPDSKLKALKIV